MICKRGGEEPMVPPPSLSLVCLRRIAANMQFGPDQSPFWIFAALSVFFISMVIVIGPAPPGTGVI